MPNIYSGTSMPNFNINSTGAYANKLAPAVQEYYDKKMLENIKPKLIHAQFGQKVNLPRGNGKTVKFRKWTPFAAITTPLTEGTVPDGQSLDMTSINATIAQYGGYVTITDLLDMTAVVPVVRDSVQLMADQGGLSVDHMVRNYLNNNATNIQYAGSNTGIGTIAATDKLTTVEIRKAVRTLKRAKAPTFSRNGKEYYVAIVSPETVYDLQSDTAWVNVSTYQDKENIYSGEIGRMFGVLFIENTEAFMYGTSVLPTIKVSSYTSGTKTITLDTALTDDQANDIVACGKIKHGSYTNAVASASGTTIVLSGTITNAPSANDVITMYGPGASGAKVASTLVLGRDAFGVVAIDGRNVGTIVKNAGSAGTADPLNQVSTVGWKVNGFTTVMLQPTWMVQILHGFSA